MSSQVSPERISPSKTLGRLRPVRLVVSLLVSTLTLYLAAAILPGVDTGGFWQTLVAALLIGAFNAVIPPIIAALPLPFTAVLGFVLVLLADAVVLMIVSDILPSALQVDSFGWALLAGILASAIALPLEVVMGVNDDWRYMLRVTRRIAQRQGAIAPTDEPGIVFLEIDGLALPVLRRAMRDGNVPTMARWVAEGTHVLDEWETDLSSQTGASQAGILLGSNDGIPAFRWVDKSVGRVVRCSDPKACAAIEARLADGSGLLAGGGTSRGNLLSGEADAAIMTVSRLSDERGPNPGYRAFLANGFTVTRTLVLVLWEVILEIVASARQRRRDVRPRGHRGGSYPFVRAGVCVAVRDILVHSVVADMMAGRPAIYATFASYDEVAHHSGLERHDTLEALRKLDQQFALIEMAGRHAPRPYEIVVLSDHGQTQGATFLQRNCYGLDDLVRRHLSSVDGTADVAPVETGEENDSKIGRALDEAVGAKSGKRADPADVSGQDAVVLGSGNLGLVSLMEHPGRASMEWIEDRHPELLPALRAHPHIGFVMVRSDALGPVVLGPRGMHVLRDGRVEGEDPLAPFPANAARHLLRTDGFDNAPDILVNSFYDAVLEEGCAFEELISFHGGLGGPQTRPFVMYPATLPPPDEPLVGAAAVHGLLTGWRRHLRAATESPAPAAG